MKVLAFVVDCFVDGQTPSGHCTFNVHYLTSDGQLSADGTFNVDISETEGQITQSLKSGVADAVNTALSTSLTAADVRLF
jgi:hypothetical protein